MDLLGITLKNRKLDGISLLPLLQGKEMKKRSKALPFWRVSVKSFIKGREHKPIYTEEELTGWWRPFQCYEYPIVQKDNFTGWAAWIEGKWKLHKNKKDKFELYDIEADPAESTDLASQFPEVVKDLARKLYDWQCSVDVSLTGEDYKIKPTIHQK